MKTSYLKGLLIILLGVIGSSSRATDVEHKAIVPVSIGNLNISGSTTAKENLKRVVYFPSYKGLLMIGFMHYVYNINHQDQQTLLNLTTVLFYTLLKNPTQLKPSDYKEIFQILSNPDNTNQQIISKLLVWLKNKDNNPQAMDLDDLNLLKADISGISINLRSAILQIAEIARGNFDAVSPFIINTMVQDMDWSDFDKIFNDQCDSNKNNCATIRYYQKSLQAINHGHNIFLNCAKDKNRRRNRNDFALYNENVRWLDSTTFINGQRMSGAIELSGLNHSAEDGNLGSLWDKVCNAPITQDFLR